MIESKAEPESNWVDPDDAPELTDEWFEHADLYHGDKLIRRGRPRVEHPKQRVTWRLDEDVVSALRASGRGWQTRVNAVLRDFVKRGEEERSRS